MWISLQLLAAEATATVPGYEGLLQYGALGVIAFLGIAFARQQFTKQEARNDELTAENKRLNELFQERMVPALLKSTEVGSEMVKYLQEVRFEQEVKKRNDRD